MKKRKWISVLMAVVLLLQVLPFSALAMTAPSQSSVSLQNILPNQTDKCGAPEPATSQLRDVENPRMKGRIKKIAFTSPQFAYIISKLGKKGFVFDLDSARVVLPAPQREKELSGIAGIALHGEHRSDPRIGADIFITVNLTSARVKALRYTFGEVIGRQSFLVKGKIEGEMREISHRELLGPAVKRFCKPISPSRLVGSDSGHSPECIPYEYKECTGWYYDHCCQMEFCVCCYGWHHLLGCRTELRCTCDAQYRNCRDCTHCIGCGSWYSEWREVHKGCTGIGCNP